MSRSLASSSGPGRSSSRSGGPLLRESRARRTEGRQWPRPRQGTGAGARGERPEGRGADGAPPPPSRLGGRPRTLLRRRLRPFRGGRSRQVGALACTAAGRARVTGPWPTRPKPIAPPRFPNTLYTPLSEAAALFPEAGWR